MIFEIIEGDKRTCIHGDDAQHAYEMYCKLHRKQKATKREIVSYYITGSNGPTNRKRPKTKSSLTRDTIEDWPMWYDDPTVQIVHLQGEAVRKDVSSWSDAHDAATKRRAW